MITIFRRYLVLQSFLLWQGGFLFYSAVVVPIGTRILGSAEEQGRITREVTIIMNQIGLIALLFTLIDLWTIRTPSWFRAIARIAWLTMLLSLIYLMILHPEMSQLMDEASESFLDHKHFRPLHRTYLWTITVQWVAGLVYLLAIVILWQKQDRITKSTSNG